MPSPPGSKESQKNFISRCISYMTRNIEGDNPAHRAAICYSMWENRNKKKEEETEMRETKQALFEKAGKVPTVFHSDCPEIPEDKKFKKPKSYIEELENEVREDVSDRYFGK